MENVKPGTKAEATTTDEDMQKDDRKRSARTKADSSTGDENNSVSQHSRKPPVVGSQMSSNDEKENYWMKYPKSDSPNAEIGIVEKVSENDFGVQYKIVNLP